MPNNANHHSWKINFPNHHSPIIFHFYIAYPNSWSGRLAWRAKVFVLIWRRRSFCSLAWDSMSSRTPASTPVLSVAVGWVLTPSNARSFDPKKALKIVKGVQKIDMIFCWCFKTHMHLFKPLLDFLKQILSFFLIWVILGAFWPQKGPKNSQKGPKNLKKTHCFRRF